MAYRARLAESAERDRDRIVLYLLDEFGSPQAAGHFMDELDAVIANLEAVAESFPLAREARVARMGYRKALFMNYIALFKVEGDEANVARIFHQSQDYAKLV